MRVILSGGGTGGHIYPAIAIANKIKETHPEAQILFIGTEKGLENEIVPRAGYPIEHITVSYIKRKISVHNLKSMGMLIKGMIEARKIIKRFKPDIVIGTGGFVCGPVVYMASRLGIKTMIHEQNVFPGLTNRLLEKHVDKIAISFEKASQYFKNKSKLVITGNPIRNEFVTITEEQAKERYGNNDKLPMVLIVGGSGGAAKINNAVVGMGREHHFEHFKVLLVTGKRHYDSVKENMKDFKEKRNIEVLPYIDDMPYALKACDLVVCSAGAITIAEVTAVGKPSILIPKAYTAENHQEYNAKALEEKGAAIMIKENELCGEVLFGKINEVLKNENKKSDMEKSSRQAAITDAVSRIYSEIGKLIGLV